MKKARNGIFETLISKIFRRISSNIFFWWCMHLQSLMLCDPMPVNIMIIINYCLYLKREVINGLFDFIVSGFCCHLLEFA